MNNIELMKMIIKEVKDSEKKFQASRAVVEDNIKKGARITKHRVKI